VPAGPSTAAADRRQVLRRGVIVAAAEEVHTGAEGVRPYNGPVAASGRDSTAYGSERPGMNNEWNFMNSIPDSAVDEWVAHMKSNGISRVISLLSAKELTFYTTPLEELYHRAFGKSWRELNLRKEGALEKAMQYLDDAADNGEKVVIHCSGGQGRTALILASWLVHKYGLTPEEAVTEVCVNPLSITSSCCLDGTKQHSVCQSVACVWGGRHSALRLQGFVGLGCERSD